MATAKRISGANGLRALVSELEDYLTPAIVDEINSDSKLGSVLTGDYHLDTDTSKKTTTLTFYAKTKDKAPREQSVKGFLEVVEDNILEVSHKDFEIDTQWEKDSKFTTGILKVVIKSGDVVKHTIRYGIKPESGAKASLYEVTAQECLQAVGCAYLQANKTIDIDDFTGFLNYAHDIAIGNGSTKENDKKWGTALKSVISHTDFGSKVNAQRADVYAFGIGDEDWVQSTVSIAKELESLLKNNTYIFCYPDSDMVKWWKTAYDDAKKQVISKNGVFAGVTSGQLDINKWNPADIFAVKSTFDKPKFTNLKITKKNETTKITESELSYKMKAIGNKKSSKIDIGDVIKERAKKASTVEGLPSLNQWILNQAKSGEFYPISLKKAGSNANLTWINDTEHDVSFEATLESVEWKDEWRGKATNKVEVHFKINVDGSVKDYFINARQFNEGADIKLQIEKTGALAFHGKVGLKITSLIINKTDSRIKSRLTSIRKNKRFTDRGLKLSSTLFSSVSDIEDTWKDTKDAKGCSQVLLDYAGLLSKRGVTKIPKTGSGHVSKIQATEFGYIITRAEEKNVASYILYSLFTFAGSRGLVLFDGKDFKNHFASSVHIKVQ
tara:strand:+ start:1239 stop:3074 length:1836 start_codon:yes stop_codon:yes gene_type:complete